MAKTSSKSASMTTLAVLLLLSIASHAVAAPLTGDSTSTYVGVYSGLNTLQGFSNFVFIGSSKRLGLLTSSPLSTLNIAGSPPESSTSTFLLFGSNSIVAGNASGTYIGANPLVFNGDFVHFQVASTSKFRVDSSGSLTATNLTVTGLDYGVIVASGTAQVTAVVPGSSGNVLTSNGSQWQSSPLTRLTSVFTFGEDVNAGEAVYISDGTVSSPTPAFEVDSGGTLTTSLEAYYKLEDTNDFSGNGRHLTNIGSTAFSAGKVSNAADFGTSNSSKDLETTNSLGINGGNMSMAFWVKISTAPGTNVTYVLAQQANSNSQVEYMVHYVDSGGTKQLKWIRGRHGVFNDTLTVNTDLAVGTWYHIVLTYDATNVEGWLNGASQGTVASSGNGSSGSTTGFALGYQFVGGGAYTSGLIDEAGVWGKKLSSTEVADLYNSGSGQTMTSGPGNGSAGRVYRTSATNRLYSDGFIGFAAATTTAGSSGNVVVAGIANTATALTVGKLYYLGNTSGTLSTSPGTVTRRAGVAVSTSSLNITNVW